MLTHHTCVHHPRSACALRVRVRRCRARARQGVHRHRALRRRCVLLTHAHTPAVNAHMRCLHVHRLLLSLSFPVCALADARQASCWRRCWSAARTRSATRAPSSSRCVLLLLRCPHAHTHNIHVRTRSASTASARTQILEGVAYLHARRITHRDLKARSTACARRTHLLVTHTAQHRRMR